jgi:hypothetical protein
LFVQVYENFLEEIDGVDNGVSAFDGVSKYKVTTTLSNRVGYLRPSWLSKEQVRCQSKKSVIVLF